MSFKSGFSRFRSTAYRSLPLAIHSRIDCFRNKLRYQKCSSKLLFIHVPRSAGTSISRYMYGTSVLHVSASSFLASHPKFFCDNFSFSFLRHPFSRFLSAYKFVRANGSSHLSIDYHKIYSSPSFESPLTFARFIRDNPSTLYCDHIFTPQFTYVCDKSCKPLVNFLGRFEELQIGLRKISQKTGYDFSQLKHLNSSNIAKSFLNDVQMKALDEHLRVIYKIDYDLYNSL